MTEIEQRRQAAAAILAENKIEALLVSSPANVRYLSDYAGSNGLMLITSSESHFFTDPRYKLEASEKVTCRAHVAKGPLIAAAAAIIKRKRLKKIGFESTWLPYEEYAQLKKLMRPGSSLAPCRPTDRGAADAQVAG